MKNKKNIYFLLPLVIVIWGAVLYQFFNFSDTEKKFSQNPELDLIKPLNFKKREIVKIDVNYRDPFLGKMYTPNTTSNKSQLPKKIVRKNKPITKSIEPVIWPTISYKGIVSDTKDKNKVFMLIIDGRTFLMRSNNKENGILLVRGDRESIEVEYKNESKLILIE